MNILVIFDYYASIPLRQTFSEYLNCFGHHSPGEVFYCNYAYGIPSYLSKVSFDLILFHQGFACSFRWSGASYEQYLSRLPAWIRSTPAQKVIFCQDEFLKMDRINRFVKDYELDAIFTVAEESEWQKLYPDLNQTKTFIYKVLTGYLDDQVAKRVTALSQEVPTRDIDIGYRATQAEPWLGKQGLLKIDVADHVEKAARKKGLVTDICTINDEKKFFHGLDWYRFMLRCKAFIGVEGGSSLLDMSGDIREKILTYLKQHPKSPYSEIEKACFPHLDGNLNLVALSPRHLEACATKTCQILVEGSYSGILKPGIHYIELKKDFSNVDDALEQFQHEATRTALVERAYSDIVESGLYTYSQFVAEVLRTCLKNKQLSKKPVFSDRLFHKYNQLKEKKQWTMMPLEFFWFKKIKKLLPQKFIDQIKLLRNRT